MQRKNRGIQRLGSTIIVEDRQIENNLSEETILKIEAARMATEMISARVSNPGNYLTMTDVHEKWFERIFNVVLTQLKK